MLASKLCVEGCPPGGYTQGARPPGEYPRARAESTENHSGTGWGWNEMGRDGMGQDGTAHLSLFSTESSARHAWQQVRLLSWYWRIRTWHSVPFEMFDCRARGSMEGRWQLWGVTAFSGLVLNSRSGCRILQGRALPVEQAHQHEQTAVGFA